MRISNRLQEVGTPWFQKGIPSTDDIANDTIEQDVLSEIGSKKLLCECYCRSYVVSNCYNILLTTEQKLKKKF